MSISRLLLLVVLGLVLFVSLFGLNDNLNYDGFKLAIEHMEASTKSFVSDISFTKCIFTMVQNFDVDYSQKIEVDWTAHTTYYNKILFVSRGTDDSVVSTVILSDVPVDVVEFTGFYRHLQWFEHDKLSSNWFVKAIDTVVVLFRFLIGAVFSIISIVFSTIELLWSALQSFFYLVGLAPSLFANFNKGF